ncbi:Uu.00g079380.m01.CDS01 [Anthostomella pinea]|uniref:Uu.00g079380.m01.CDS01 n=1 Tax=Anthostomella pinea TaxID=933095 RepID=A0AAI8YJ88_9PEZI|nr:Uu.00g079380.m01.CDS01 [Anthostomella pinea]
MHLLSNADDLVPSVDPLALEVASDGLRGLKALGPLALEGLSFAPPEVTAGQDQQDTGLWPFAVPNTPGEARWGGRLGQMAGQLLA